MFGVCVIRLEEGTLEGMQVRIRKRGEASNDNNLSTFAAGNGVASYTSVAIALGM